MYTLCTGGGGVEMVESDELVGECARAMKDGGRETQTLDPGAAFESSRNVLVSNRFTPR